MKTSGFFKNDYTFTIADMPGQYQQLAGVIQANAEAVINYLSDYISWKGVLDFVVKFAAPDAFNNMANGQGLLPAFGGIASNGQTHAAYEAQTGVDANGGNFDAGAHILPNANGTLTNYGAALYFDPAPNPYGRADIPSGQHDFFSIYLHETLHALGVWSTAQHGSQFGQSAFDRLTQLVNGQYFFVGAETQSVLGGQALPLATVGSRDHYGVRADGAPSPINRGAVFELGNYEQNRWHLGKVDVAVLKDLGYTVANMDRLPLTEEDDSAASGPRSTEGPDMLFGGAGDNLIFAKGGNDTVFAGLGRDTVYAGDGNDIAYGGDGNDQVYGGFGNDTVGGGVGDDTVGGGHGDDVVFGGAGNDLLFGGDGNDNIVASFGRDTVVAGAGNDTVNGGDGDDEIYGADGSDVLFGGAGADTLFGGAGSDTLWGGGGSDELWGGAGGDVYAFLGGSGEDQIRGFNAGEGDRLDLGGQTYSQSMNASGHVVLALSGGGIITLEGVTSFNSDFIA